jgi:hypothetical protein
MLSEQILDQADRKITGEQEPEVPHVFSSAFAL